MVLNIIYLDSFYFSRNGNIFEFINFAAIQKGDKAQSTRHKQEDYFF
jgi:hypothetical protein